MKKASISAVVAVTVLGMLAIYFLGLSPPAVLAQRTSSAATETVPVEGDMHELMEYYFQPTHRRLKASMAAAPADNPAWKSIKADALILAEGSNLLLGRVPDQDSSTWRELSVQVREAGSQLYQSAKKKDFDKARGHYTAMLKKCNACHQHFAEGEHQLEP